MKQTLSLILGEKKMKSNVKQEKKLINLIIKSKRILKSDHRERFFKNLQN